VVKIRLKRMGAKKRPFYRLVVADSRSPRDGRFIEEVGSYDPIANPARVHVDAERVREWMSRGARPSDIARKLLEQQGVLQRSPRPRAAAAAAEPGASPAEPSGAAEEEAGR
jgi:small subunit ribosomal protein S16